MNDVPGRIKETLDMRQICESYGIEVNRAGFILCPFHSEDTPSLKLYADGWHCFGCGAGGDVIDFVKGLFNLPFMDAVKKLDEDFRLGLDVGRKLSQRERLQFEKERFQRQQEAKRKRAEADRIEDEYWTAYERWLVLDEKIRTLAPKSPDEPPDLEFLDALQNIGMAEYMLDCADERRLGHEKRNRNNP